MPCLSRGENDDADVSRGRLRAEWGKRTGGVWRVEAGVRDGVLVPHFADSTRGPRCPGRAEGFGARNGSHSVV